MPNNILLTFFRVFPSLFLLPWQFFFRGGVAFVHPISKISGKVKFKFAAEIGFGTVIKAGKLGVEIGSYSQINENCVLAGNIVIKDRVLVAPSVSIVNGGHKFGSGVMPRFSGGGEEKITVIHEDVWIGAGVTIVGGIDIGKGSVIAAGVVLDQSVPEGTLVRRINGEKLQMEKIR